MSSHAWVFSFSEWICNPQNLMYPSRLKDALGAS